MGQPLSKQQKELLALINSHFKDDEATIEIHPRVFMEQENARWQSVFHKTLVLVTLRTLMSNLQSKGYFKVKFKKDVWLVTRVDKPKPKPKANVEIKSKSTATKPVGKQPEPSEIKSDNQAQTEQSNSESVPVKQDNLMAKEPVVQQVKPLAPKPVESKQVTTTVDVSMTTVQSEDKSTSELDDSKSETPEHTATESVTKSTKSEPTVKLKATDFDKLLADVFTNMEQICRTSRKNVLNRQRQITIGDDDDKVDKTFEHLIKR